EGLVVDGTILSIAIKKGLKVPRGRFYLANSRYSKNLDYILVVRTKEVIRNWYITGLE
ncbi:uncharacterized protein MYCFIDRAFT_38390, partial [Pseudocercospora fijiensis CIRAD86]